MGRNLIIIFYEDITNFSGQFIRHISYVKHALKRIKMLLLYRAYLKTHELENCMTEQEHFLLILLSLLDSTSVAQSVENLMENNFCFKQFWQ